MAVAGDARSLGRSKHIARRSQFLIEAQGRRQIKCRHISGDVQAADLLTKPLDRKRFVSLRRYLMNTDAMVEAPIEDRSGMNDRNRSGTDHGGVSMRDCSTRSPGSS